MSRLQPSSCDRHRELLALSQDGPLAARDQESLERHLTTCEACRAFSETLPLVDRWVTNAWAAETEASEKDADVFLAALMNRIERTTQAPRSIWRRVALAAAILLVLGWLALVLEVVRRDAAREVPSPVVREEVESGTQVPRDEPERELELPDSPRQDAVAAADPDDDSVDPLRLYGARYVVEKALLNSHGLEGEELLAALREKTRMLRRERWPIELLVLKLVDRKADEPSHLEADERAMLVALRWIGAVRPSGALPVLERVLEPEPRTEAIRERALLTLAQLGQERALDRLVDYARLTEDYPEAPAALAQAGDLGLERLLSLFEGSGTPQAILDVLENHAPALDRVLARRIGTWELDDRHAELYRRYGGERCRSRLLAEAERKRRLGRGLVTVAVAIGGVEAFDLLLETVDKSSPREREKLTASLTKLLEQEGAEAPSLVQRSALLVRERALERINALDALTAAAARVESGQASDCLLAILRLEDLDSIQKANVLLHLLNRPSTEAPELERLLAERLADPDLSPIEFAGVLTVLAGRSTPEAAIANLPDPNLDDARRRRLVRGLSEAAAAQPGVAGLTALDRLLPITEGVRRRLP